MHRYTHLAGAVAAVVLAMAGQARATDFQWNDLAGGSFHAGSKWSPAGGPPGPGDSAWFSLNAPSAYMVAMVTDVSNQRLVVENDQLKLQIGTLPAATYTLTASGAAGPSVVVGDASGTAELNLSGRVSAVDSVLGRLPLVQGTLNLSGASTTWANSGSLAVGDAGTGIINADTGAAVSAATVSLGGAADGTGVIGLNAASLQVGGALTIADAGSATISLDSASSAGASSLVIGTQASANGALLVGTDSSVAITGVMEIGSAGIGAVGLGENARLDAGSATLGVSPAPSGDFANATLDISASEMHVSNHLQVGLDGQAEVTLNLATLSSSGQDKRALLSSGSASVGGESQGAIIGAGSGSVVLYSSDFQAGASLHVGSGGTGTVVLDQQSTLSSGSAMVGDAAGFLVASGVAGGVGFVDMAGGSAWTNPGSLVVGAGSTGNGTVNIQGGSTLTTGTAEAPAQAIVGDAGGGQVVIADDQSVWTHHGDLLVAASNGSGGSILVDSSGQLVTDRLLVGGDGAGAGGSGSVTVQTASAGPVSKLTVNGTAEIGRGGDGSLQVLDMGVASITGSLIVGKGSAGAIGDVSVLGTDAQLSAGPADVGLDGQGSVSVGNGASLTTGPVRVGANAGSEGTASVQPGGTWLALGLVYVGGGAAGPGGTGTLSVDHGTFQLLGPLTIWNSGTLLVNDPTLVTSVVLLNGGTISGRGTVTSAVNASGGKLIASSGRLVLSGIFTTRPGAQLNKQGAGLLTIAGAQNHSAGAQIAVQAGTLELVNDAGSSAAANLRVVVGTSATAQFDSAQHLEGLVVGSGGKAVAAPGGGATLIVHGLSIDTSGAVPGTVDLMDNDLVWADAGSNAYGQARQWILAGRSGTAGLISSASMPGTDRQGILAPVDNMLLHLQSWNGMVISDGSDFHQVIVKYTYPGDTNLDGRVDDRDYINILANMGQSGTWFDGDVNLDGVVTRTDYDLVTANLGAGDGTAAHGPQLATVWTYGADSRLAVPEPGSLGVLALAGLLLRRAGRRQAVRG